MTDLNIKTPVSTYNPQERTFIKKPESRVCTSCGQQIHDHVQGLRNAMNKYVNKQTGLVIGVINDDKEQITTPNGDVLVREDIYLESKAAVPQGEVGTSTVAKNTTL